MTPKARGQLATIWVPGKLENPLNGSHGHWSKRARWAKVRREKAQMCILAVTRTGVREWPRPQMVASAPKIITFHAYVHTAFDGDGLQAALKPTRDALKDMRIIDDDRDSSGHRFIYTQEISRGKNAKRGVEITVEVAG